MSDVLKQSLFWSGNPTFAITDVNGTGGSEARAITAAESHDASDTTYEGLGVSGDGFGTNGDVTGTASRAVGTASVSGAISFIRVKARARVTGNGGESGTWQPRINGTDRGTAMGLSGSFTDYTQDFATDPADSAAWTNAKINAQTFGARLEAGFSDLSSPGAATLRMSEWSIEVWGPSAVVETPSSLSVPLVIGVALGIVGLIVAAATSISCVATVNDPTVVLGGLSEQPDSLAIPVELPDMSAGVKTLGYDPTTVGPIGILVDGNNVFTTVRSNTSPYKDESLATKTLLSSPGSWPNSGSLVFNFGGLGSTGISGTGLITGVKCFAIIRPRKDTHAVLNNFRFTGAGHSAVLSPQPTVFGMLPASADWATVESPMITDVGGLPFSWDPLSSESVFTAFINWSLSADYSVGGSFSGEFAQVEVAEAWVEVHGPIGVLPEFINLRQGLGDLNVVQGLTTVILKEQGLSTIITP